MSSQDKINANRANGARSRGPVTPEGKKRSSMNALRHGLLAETVIVGKESEAAFDEMLQEHLEHFRPTDGVERAMIEEMVAAKWRQLRALAIDNEWLEQELADEATGHERSRIAGAFGRLADKNRVALLNRYETRLYRMYHRSLRSFVLLLQLEITKQTQAGSPPPPPPRPSARRPSRFVN